MFKPLSGFLKRWLPLYALALGVALWGGPRIFVQPGATTECALAVEQVQLGDRLANFAQDVEMNPDLALAALYQVGVASSYFRVSVSQL